MSPGPCLSPPRSSFPRWARRAAPRSPKGLPAEVVHFRHFVLRTSPRCLFRFPSWPVPFPIINPFSCFPPLQPVAYLILSPALGGLPLVLFSPPTCQSAFRVHSLADFCFSPSFQFSPAPLPLCMDGTKFPQRTRDFPTCKHRSSPRIHINGVFGKFYPAPVPVLPGFSRPPSRTSFFLKRGLTLLFFVMKHFLFKQNLEWVLSVQLSTLRCFHDLTFPPPFQKDPRYDQTTP